MMDELIASMVNRKERERPVEDGPNNSHYGEMTLEPLEVARHWLGNDHLEGAYLFQIIKYLGRYRMSVPGKGGKTDLLKMRDYLNLLIELKDEHADDGLSGTR